MTVLAPAGPIATGSNLPRWRANSFPSEAPQWAMDAIRGTFVADGIVRNH
jgi:hypothetical protein